MMPPVWPNRYGPWESVPWWHWRRLIGHDIRCRLHNCEYELEWWRYGRSRIIAHELLRHAFAPTPQKGECRWPNGVGYNGGQVWNGENWMIPISR